VSNVETFTQPYRLTQKEEKQAQQEEAELPFYYVYGGYIEELRKIGLDLPKEMLDYELTNFMNNVDETKGPVEREVKTMVRIKATDYRKDSDHKRKEFLVWYSHWYGNTKDDIEIQVNDYPNGMEKQVVLEGGPQYDNKGNKLKPKARPPRLIYTVEFKPEIVEELVTNSARGGEDTIQYLVTGKGSWGGFTYDEFKDMSFEDLEERGRKGTAGSPVVKNDKRKG
jgi:hypothetical protein